MAVYAMPGDYTVVMAIGVILAFAGSFAIVRPPPATALRGAARGRRRRRAALTQSHAQGANDVANSFANAVASRSITLKWACVFAGVAEFLGALLLGKSTGETLRGGLVKVSRFADHPTLLMLAMQCALIGAAGWILIATYYGMPVSTTHSIVGAVIGVAVAAFGGEAVNWAWDGRGVAQIVASWFISPALAASLAAILFGLLKLLVLKRKNSFRKGLVTVPIFFAFGLFINTYLITTKGMPNMDLIGSGQFTEAQLVGVSIAVGVGASAILSTIMILWAKKTLDYKYVMGPDGKNVLSPQALAEAEQEKAKVHALQMKTLYTDSAKVSPSADGTGPAVDALDGASSSNGEKKGAGSTFKDVLRKSLMKAKNAALKGVNVDVVSIEGKTEIEEMHSLTEDYDPKTEDLFKLLLITSSTLACFAHGSNDVANSIGPFATVFAVWKEGSNYMCDGALDGRCWAVARPVSTVEAWILAFGGAGIVIGLSTWGYKVMSNLGNNLVKMSPSRGFCIDIGASITVIFASAMGWPVSTTQCAVGATTGVGVISASNPKDAARTVNWKLFARMGLNWIMTLPAAGLTSALIFAYVAYTPAAWATEQQSVTFFPNSAVEWTKT
eukprot:tig00000836_g4690.t1